MAYFKFTEAILAGRPIEVYNGGDLWRDFTYIDDIVEGVVRLIDHIPTSDPRWDADSPDPATSSAPYRVFNIGNSCPVKLMDFIATLEKLLGVSAVLVRHPMQQGDVIKTFADTTGLRKLFGWSPTTSIDEGLRNFVNWYQSYILCTNATR